MGNKALCGKISLGFFVAAAVCFVVCGIIFGTMQAGITSDIAKLYQSTSAPTTSDIINTSLKYNDMAVAAAAFLYLGIISIIISIIMFIAYIVP